MERRKLKRRMDLFDDMLDFALRSPCRFAFCDGPKAPVRHGYTCTRCHVVHRALKMGLVKEVEKTYVRKTSNGDVCVMAGVLEQFSVCDGRLLG